MGKAKNLRARLSSYFQDFTALHPRTQAMVTAAHSVDWVTVGTEVEALTLEYTWIKEHDPRFNVRYRDDKSYPYLSVSVGETFPRVAIVREAKRSGVRYFGPYAHAWAIRETLDQLTRVFPVRSCRDGVFARAVQQGRPCLLGYIDRCAAPCVGKVTENEYRRIVDDLCAFLGGSTQKYVRELQVEMKRAASEERYEDAAKLRDQLGALDRVLERNAVALADATDADFIAVIDDPLHVGVEVFHVRTGRVVGERSFIVEKAEDLELDGYVERIMQRLYGGGLTGDQSGVPREILLNVMPSDVETVRTWLGNLRSGPVQLHVPKRGDKAQLLETALENASQALNRHKLKRSSDITARSAALAQLQADLGLAEPPFRIECIDISTLQGTDTVASVVVFEDALPVKNQYRTYKVRTEGADDLTAVREIVERRFAPRDGEGGEPRHRYPTSLLVIDGAAGQVRAAEEALATVGRSDLPVVGLAKRLEEVWTSEDPEPVILSRTSEGLFLLQRIRDEAHRVAITFHRKQRSQRSRGSALEAVPGLGPTRVKALLKAFGSMKALGAATPAEIAEVPGIGPVLAQTIHNALASNHEPDS